MEKRKRVYRPISDLEYDFAELLASRLPLVVAREKFDHLWDEVNEAAAVAVSSPQAGSYLGLLKRMQHTYESRYTENCRLNGRRVTYEPGNE